MKLLAACNAVIGLVASTSTAFSQPLVTTTTPAQLAIIIDDLGYRREETERAISLPGPIALAFLPYAPHTNQMARQAHAAGKEVLLHQPLAAIDETEMIDRGELSLDNTALDVHRILLANLRAVPFVIGINTHRGSLLTQHPGHMRWLMQELATISPPLIFVDSRTSEHSVALDIAREYEVPSVARDVFLDGDRDPLAIAQEFKRFTALAKLRGAALAIGHPYPETLEFLEKKLPGLEPDVELVPLSRYVRDTQNAPRVELVPADMLKARSADL